jgi:uncharacterized integral membrane protein (TIGR00698 family)
MRFLTHLIPGILLIVALAILAYFLAKYVSLSLSMIAILLGATVGNLLGQPKATQAGVNWSESQLLAVAVALLGAELNMNVLLELNGVILLVVVVSLLVTFSVTMVFAKWFKVAKTTACLVASGQAICGSAAVMAAQKIVKANPTQVALVVSLVNFLGFLGVFITTWLVTTYFIQDINGAGLMIGNTLQSMGHVVAAGLSVNEDVNHAAVLIKMCRILLLIPMMLVLIYFNNAKQAVASKNLANINWLQTVPLFIWVFILLSVFSTMNWLPLQLQNHLAQISQVLFVFALVAIGLNLKVKQIWQQGGKLLLLGTSVFAVQLLFTFLVLRYL